MPTTSLEDLFKPLFALPKAEAERRITEIAKASGITDETTRLLVAAISEERENLANDDAAIAYLDDLARNR
ncbi:unnamed protein product [Gemmataceae bacterium]|nr:unnamed protein product [Gemmataceae bacterium]VTU02418.1 unnamed protein product [Gemmataceae bacterium]